MALISRPLKLHKRTSLLASLLLGWVWQTQWITTASPALLARPLGGDTIKFSVLTRTLVREKESTLNNCTKMGVNQLWLVAKRPATCFVHLWTQPHSLIGLASLATFTRHQWCSCDRDCMWPLELEAKNIYSLPPYIKVWQPPCCWFGDRILKTTGIKDSYSPAEGFLGS